MWATSTRENGSISLAREWAGNRNEQATQMQPRSEARAAINLPQADAPRT